ncbi:glutathione S-transferase [Amaricoccus sp. HAR-UPW-R2A-40]|nr:glutathione S-transferase [Amaricoccus sp. HAR-UPW-R2A-40]
MAEYKLHCFAQSGNSYKPALLLALSGADWEPVFVDFFNGAARTPEFKALNEMGEAPVLDHGEVRLTQSGVILDYLSLRFRDFAPRSEADRREVLRWTLWDNHKLTSYTASLRFLRTFVPEEKRDPGVLAWLEGRARAAMKVLDGHLAEREWIVGERPTTADLSCVGYLYYDGELGYDVADYPNVDRWRQAIAALPGWAHPYQLMPGQTQA